MEVKIEERDVKAVYFSSGDGDAVDLLTKAAEFLDTLNLDEWQLLSVGYEATSRLMLFLERKPTVIPHPPTDAAHSQPPYDVPKEVNIRYLT